MMLHWSIIAILLLCIWIPSTFCDTFTDSALGEKLGYAFEFKIHLSAGKEECFYQDIHTGSTLYVAFQVVRGGDGKAGFGIRNPRGEIIVPYEWKENAEYEETIVNLAGPYQFCIDNSLSRFAEKVVSLYCATYQRDNWEKYIDELTESDGRLSNVTSLLQNVDHNIGSMLKHVDHSRRVKQHDFLMLDSNNNYVQNLSVLQCIVIIAVSITQVFIVRKLLGGNDNLQSSHGYKPCA